MAISIEDAGFEIRDQIMWVYGQGMPKGKNLKPAHEPICVARKPFKGTIKDNVAFTVLDVSMLTPVRLNVGHLILFTTMTTLS